MSRAGIPWNQVCDLDVVLRAAPPQGAFTHFHSAERNDASRAEQEQRFAEAIAAMPARPPMLHAENSPAIEHRGPSPWSLARPGIFLYGVGSGNSPMISPDPVVAVRARVIDLRTVPAGDTVSYGGSFRAESDCRIATLAIGYADGYRRALSNRGSVLVRGRRAPVVGVVTMDMTMVDVTDIQCEIGDIATLIGADGDDRIDVTHVAAMGELSPYEVLTGLRGRLPHRYLESEI
jgi:alanine racemase